MPALVRILAIFLAGVFAGPHVRRVLSAVRGKAGL